jgi:hypothetical protein
MERKAFLDEVEKAIVARSGVKFVRHSSPDGYRRWVESLAYPKQVRFLISATKRYAIVEMHVKAHETKKGDTSHVEWNRAVMNELKSRPQLVSKIKAVCPEFVNNDAAWDFGEGLKGLHLKVITGEYAECQGLEVRTLIRRTTEAFLDFRAVLEPELAALSIPLPASRREQDL